jgi:hypothetical protein
MELEKNQINQENNSKQIVIKKMMIKFKNKLKKSNDQE